MITDFIRTNENCVLIAVVIFLITMTLYGHYRGFVRMAVSFSSAIISLFLVRWILPYFTSTARESRFFQQQTERLTEGLLQGTGAADYSALYEQLGIAQAAQATGEYLAGILLNVICFLVLFVVINLLFKVAAHFLNALMQLPVLHGTNQLCGAAVGFLEAIFYLWIILIAISFTLTSDFSQAVLQQINESSFLLWLYRNNFLLQLLAGVFGGL